MNRRDLLKLAAAAALAQSLPRYLLAGPDSSGSPFALGVASGSPSHDGFVLWTRLMPPESGFNGKPVAVNWQIAHDEHFRRVVQQGSAPALPELGYSVHVETAGLEADRWYFYRFQCGNARSVTGRTRTFPNAGSKVARMRLAYASCQRWEEGYYAAWRHMQGEQLDAVFFLGDYIYEYSKRGKGVRSHPLGRPSTLADYRDRYALYKSDANLQGMHAQCPWLLTWDDHEVINDYASLTAPGLPKRFAAQRAAAYQAYYENMPLPAAVLTQALTGMPQGAEMRLYGSTAFGDLADFHLLDTRQYRDRQACAPKGGGGGGSVKQEACAELQEAGRSMLGMAQERWLADSLQASARRAPRWTVIAQETLFCQRYAPGKNGPSSDTDSWDGYPASRQRVIDALAHSKAPNPVMLGGDLHSNWVGYIKADFAEPASATVGVEFCGTSISSDYRRAASVPEVAAQNPHFVFADGLRRGYGVVELSHQALRTDLRVVNDVTQPDSGIATLASFAVQAGRPMIEKI